MQQYIRAFERSQSNRLITNVLLLIGMVLSLILAFPLMIGHRSLMATGVPLFFFVPIVACYGTAKVITLLRN